MSDSYWDREEDFLEAEEEKAPWWRSRPALIFIITLCAVIVLSFIWHALLPSNPSNTDVPYVKADTTPIKVRPENPGGAEIPHRDKMVYDLISSNKAEPRAVKETLTPKPEKPLYGTGFSSPTELSQRTEEVAVEAVPAPVAPPKKPVPVDIFKDKPLKKKAQKKAAPKPQGKYRIQIEALRSQKAAEGEIKVLKRKFKSLRSLPISVIKAKVKGKTYFRVQAGRFQTKKEALAACTRLKKEGGQCMLAR